MGARAVPEAEIHGSGSETGEVVKDPEGTLGSKPGREEQGRVGRRVLEASDTPAPLLCGTTGPGSKTQVVGAGCLNFWIYGQKC